MKHKVWLWLTAVVLLSLHRCADADWPQWRGPTARGVWDAPPISPDWPESGLPVAWEQTIGPAYSGITVAAGRVFTMDRPRDGIERVVCLDAGNGKLLWDFEYEADYGDLDYGKGPRSTPTIHAGRVFTLGAVGHVYCLNAETGKPQWSIDTVADLQATQPTWGFAASPVTHGDNVIVHIGAKPAGCYVAFSQETGKEQWRGGDDPAGYCTPIIVQHNDGDQLVGWTPEHIVSLSLSDGSVNWQEPYKVSMGVSIATPTFHRGTVLVSGYWEGSKAIKLGANAEDAELLWEENRLLRGLMSQPLCRGDHVYLLDKHHGLECFELSTGKVLWNDENRLTPRNRNPQVTLVWLGGSDRAICLNADGELVLARLTPAGYEELARTKVVDETWSHPAYVGRRVYVRDDKRLVCIELPQAGS